MAELNLNGVNASTGGPIDGDDVVITTDMIAKVARGQKITPEDLRDAKMKKQLSAASTDHFGVAEGIDNTKLDETGWAVIFPAGLPQKSVDALKEALKPLLDHRKAQASAIDESFYKEVIGTDEKKGGFKNGETKNDFLKRFGRGPGPADPQFFPYYAMIVGSPETIPYTFQYQLDVQYAVGRIYFDKLEDYYQYAKSVVDYETKKVARAKKAAFFGVGNPDDKATQMSSKSLILPLAEHMKGEHKDWGATVIDPANATKANLANYMGGAETPSLLFTASHGMNFKLDDNRLLRHTGAILTQDWPGPKARVPITDNLYFSADDIASDADVFGMIAFIFACYGGGIPKSDNFYRQAFGVQKDIAPYAFVSQMPLKLLSHPKGGALGVFAHVERAWGSSIMWDGAVADTETFKSTMDALLKGKPAGVGTEYFNERYAEISTMLTEELDQTTPETQDDIKIAGMWTSNNDARNYAFIGDPAVRLNVDEKETPKAERANLGSVASKHPAGVSGASASFQPDVVDRTPAAKAAAAGGPSENFSVLDSLMGKKETAPAETAAGTAVASSAPAAKNAFTDFIEKLSGYMSKALDDATSLEVYTYVSDDLADVTYEGGKFKGARLRAMTRVNIDGDTMVCVPQNEEGEIDSAVWQIHLDMVKQAQASRSELMNTLVSAIKNIPGLGK
jgi:hypothetical protein